MELLRPEMSSVSFTLPLSCAIYCAHRLCFSAMPLIPFSFLFGDLNAWWIWSDPARVLPNKIKIQENTYMTPAPRVRIVLYNKLSLNFKVIVTLFFFALASASSFAQISDSASNQIAEVLAFKKTFSPAEQKMSSNLVLLSRRARHMPLGNLAKFINEGKMDAQGQVMVTIGADLSPSLMSSRVMSNLVKTEGQIPQQDSREGRVHGHVHPVDLLELAGHPDVKFLREADGYRTNVGAVTSQGYVSHAANKVVALGITGAGVTVGVMSDSASPARVAALIASGD